MKLIVTVQLVSYGFTVQTKDEDSSSSREPSNIDMKILVTANCLIPGGKSMEEIR